MQGTQVNHNRFKNLTVPTRQDPVVQPTIVLWVVEVGLFIVVKRWSVRIIDQEARVEKSEADSEDL